MTALTIRRDRTPAALRKLAKTETDARVARRLLAIANALSGMSRKEAAEAAGMNRQTLRDWVIRYNAHGVDGLHDCWGEGRPPRLEPKEQAELIRIVLEQNPIRLRHSLRRRSSWRIPPGRSRSATFRLRSIVLRGFVEPLCEAAL